VNICHLAPIYLPGILPGCSKYIQNISEELAKRGHELTVMTSNAVTGRGWVDPLFGKYSPVQEERINGVRVRRLKTRWQITSTMYMLKNLTGPILPRSIRNTVSLVSAGPYLSNLQDEFRRGHFQIIHVTAFPFNLVWLVRRACQFLGKTFICTPLVHFEDPSHRNPLLWKALKDANSVFACSMYEREGMVRMGVPSSKIHLIPMGIHSDGWKNAKGERFREKYNLSGKRIVLFAGTKSYNKGAVHLLQAMTKIRQEAKDAILVAIGLPTGEWKRKKGSGDGSLLDLGYVPEEEKKDAFDACDLFVMPSRYDSFGIVYLEAWRCGKPVIGARVGAIPEVIDEGRDGLLVEFGDVEQLSSAMLHLLNHPDLCRTMGEAGSKKVRDQLNWEKNISLIENVYDQARG
jgi:glycogen(starch) synthase